MPLLGLIPIVLLVVAPSCLLKLAAVLTRTKVKWAHCFIFGTVVALLTIARRGIELATGRPLPLVLSALVAIALLVSFGSWYFSSRSERKDGQPAGRGGAVKLMLVYVILLVGLVVLATLAGNAVGNRA